MIRSFKCVFALVGLATLGYLLVKHLTNTVINGISFQGASLRWENISTSGIDINITLRYFNDSEIPVPIDTLVGGIMYGNIKLADISLERPVTLTPGVVTSVSIDTSISFLSLSLDLVNAIKTKTFKGDGLVLQGSAKSSGISFPVDYKLVNI